MKNLNLMLIVIFLFISGCKTKEVWVESRCDSLPVIEFDTEEIKQGMSSRFTDSIWNKYWIEEYEKQMTLLGKVERDSFALFPYVPIDSALFYFYEPVSKKDEHLPIDRREVKDISHLCLEKTKLLLKVINNPLNFNTGECGTNIPFSNVVLFSKGEKVGNIVFGCSYTMINTFPSNPMITGGLTEHGDSLLSSIRIWE